MNSVFLICMSLLVSAGTGADARFEALPFSVDEVIQSVSQRADRIDDDNSFHIENHAFSGALEEFMIDTSNHSNVQAGPSVAFGGGNYFVVWSDYRNIYSDIYGARVDPTGTVLDPSGICITCAIEGHQRTPSASFIDGKYVVVWRENRGICCARVDTSGALLDPTGIVVSPDSGGVSSPCVACNETNCLAVWIHEPSYDTSMVWCARISPSGQVLDTSGIFIMYVIGPTQYFGSPAVASSGTNHLAVWTCFAGHAGMQLVGALIDTSGTVQLMWLPTVAWDDFNPSVAFDGTNYLVVWTFFSPWDIYGCRVDTTGTALDPEPFAISAAGGRQQQPSVAFNGANYVVVWQDNRSGIDYDIYGARVDTSGTVLDTSGIELINQPYYRAHPSIAGGPGDQLLLVYYGFEPDPYNSDRVFGALWGTVGLQEESHLVTDISHFRLGQNFPNPFSRVTDISFVIPSKSAVSLKIYDSSGRLVNTLVDQNRPAGSYAVIWDGKDSEGSNAPSGVYFYRLNAGEFTSTGKMILLR